MSDGLSLGPKPGRVDNVIPEHDGTDLRIAGEVLLALSQTTGAAKSRVEDGYFGADLAVGPDLTDAFSD